MTLQPGEYIQIVRDLQNPNIAGTFYVRATIKNAKTLAVLDTVDLVDQGSYLFSGEWLVAGIRAPGQFIVTTVVYTDSGYSVRSEDYGNFTQTYQVRDFTSANNFPVNLLPEGGVDVDYKKVRKIMKEEIAIATKALTPKAGPLTIEDIERAVRAIHENSMKPHGSALELAGKDMQKQHAEVMKAISEIEIPPPEKPDLTPVLEAISTIDEKQDKTLETLALHKKYIAAIHAGLDRVHGVVTTIDQTMSNVSNQLRSRFDKVQGFMKASEEVKGLFDQVKNFSAAWKNMTTKVQNAEKAMSEITPTEPKEKEEKEEKP